MDDQPAELPANVKSRKPKKPKGWSYPLQTMEIVAGLDLGFCGADVDIDFNNSPQRPFQFGKAIKPSHSFDILRVICFGHLSLLANDGAPKFSIYTYLCLPQNRLKLSDAWLEIFPVIKQWMAGILNKPSENQILLRYEDTQERLVLVENKKRELYSKKISLRPQNAADDLTETDS